MKIESSLDIKVEYIYNVKIEKWGIFFNKYIRIGFLAFFILDFYVNSMIAHAFKSSFLSSSLSVYL